GTPANAIRGVGWRVQPARFRSGDSSVPGWQQQHRALFRLTAEVVAVGRGDTGRYRGGGDTGAGTGRAFHSLWRGAVVRDLRSTQDGGSELGEGRGGHGMEPDLRLRGP